MMTLASAMRTTSGCCLCFMHTCKDHTSSFLLNMTPSMQDVINSCDSHELNLVFLNSSRLDSEVRSSA